MKVLAIDPGYDRVGFAIIEKSADTAHKEVVIFSECFQTEKTETLHQRNFAVGVRMRELIKKFTPDYCAIETLFFSKNTTTALQVSESRGLMIFMALDAGLELYEYMPNQIKVAVTGYGKATKGNIHAMVGRLVPLEEKKYIDDEIDAIAVGLTFFASYRSGKNNH